MHVEEREAGRLFGILPTFKRPRELSDTLDQLAEQSMPLAGLIVVDNAPGPDSESGVRAYGDLGMAVEYISSSENIGNAGAYELGMDRILSYAQDRDWIVLLDDDDPPEGPEALQRLSEFGEQMLERDANVAGVGFTGARFDWKRGRLIRIADDELDGPVPVDYLGNGHFPAYLVGAVKAVGSYSRPIFFGFGELEFGLRLRAAGYSIYVDGPVVHRQRETWNRFGPGDRPKLIGLEEATWRRYYKLRNLIYILRSHGATTAALRVTLIRGLIKPLINLPLKPRLAVAHLKLNWRACKDAWLGRMGRRIDPQGNPAGPERAPLDNREGERSG